MNPALKTPTVHDPLPAILGKVTALWAAANVGYFVLFPVFGYDASYNTAPVVLAWYFLFWALISTWVFWDLFRAHFRTSSLVWWWGVLSVLSAGALLGLLYLFSLLPLLQGPAFAPYTDLLLATPWYFLPKAFEILVQQVLIAALVLGLQAHFKSLTQVSFSYALLFGGGHIALFLLSSAPTLHAAAMTLAALLSALIFPYLLLRVRGGFIYSYVLHFVFYLALASMLHTWPPPGYSIGVLESALLFA